MLNQPEGNETFSILAIDIGSAYTRALLFNDVDGQYHFIAEGLSVTSTFDPICNVNEGMFQAIQQLQIMTGALLLDEDYHLIIPPSRMGRGRQIGGHFLCGCRGQDSHYRLIEGIFTSGCQ